MSARKEKTKEENGSVTEHWYYFEITSRQKVISIGDSETIAALNNDKYSSTYKSLYEYFSIV